MRMAAVRKTKSDSSYSISRLSSIDNEKPGSEGAKMVEVTLPALQLSGTSGTTSGERTKSLTRSRTLLITSTGQCTPVLEDDADNDLDSKFACSFPRESEPLPASKSSPGGFMGSVVFFFLQTLLWLKDQAKDKKVDATEDVLSRYHNLYLYGAVPLTIKVRAALRSGALGHTILCLEFAAAVISVVAYVRSTYTMTPHRLILFVRQICGIFFAADYLLRLYSAPVRLYYVISVTGLVDLSSALTVISLWSRFKNDGAIPHMLLVLRALRVLPSITSVGGTITQQIFLLTMYTLGGVFIAAGILQWVEFKATSSEVKAQQGCSVLGCFNFYDSFYFVVVTLTTVGYGDFTPKSNWGRLVTLMVMLAAVLILPLQINKILQVAARRPYGGRFAVQKAVGSSFVILSGNVSTRTVQHFLSGFYHPSHDKDMAAFPIRVIIMAPFKPSYEMKTLLTYYRGRVQFIEGTPLRESDLDRVGANFASAVFLLADEHAKDFDAEDAAQITRTLSVHRHCGPKVRVIVELLKPENYNNAIWDESEEGIEIICPEAVRFQLLARSCHVQGFSTFVINLFRSGLRLKRHAAEHWIGQYYNGLRQEIFPVILPTCFYEHGLTFEEVAEIVYLKHHALLIGLDVVIHEESRAVLLYPKGRTVVFSDIGLVIAKDLQIAEEISTYGKRSSTCLFRIFNTTDDDTDEIFQRLKEKRPDVETGVRRRTRQKADDSTHNSQDSTKPGSKHKLQGQFRQFYSSTSPSEHERLQAPSSPKKLELEEVIDMATSWPPLRKWDKPDPPVLERRESVILDNLCEQTMNVVMLKIPHILLCIEGRWPLNLFYFVSNLRLPYMPMLPIVILHPHAPNASQWGCVGMFEDIYFVKGSALYELDLVRAGVLQAEKVVILTQGFEDNFSSSDDADTVVNTLDVKNIVIAANVERLLNPARDRVLVELQQEVQLQFLRPHFRMEPYQFQTKMFQRDRDSQLLFAPPFIEGKGLCPASFTFLSYATFFNRNTVSIVEQLCCGRSVGDFEDADEALVRKLEQIIVPKCYVGLTFQELFLGLLHNEKMVALGLYRPAGTDGSIVSYVCTNPPPTTEIVSADLVYVLQ